MTMNLGEIRYRVFVDSDDGHPWVCRLRLVSLSPKGRNARWEAIDGAEKSAVYSSYLGHHPPASAIEAIELFQRCAVVFWPDLLTETPDECVRKIVLAEQLKQRILEKSNTVPMESAASTG